MVMANGNGARPHVKCRKPGRETMFPFGVALADMKIFLICNGSDRDNYIFFSINKYV